MSVSTQTRADFPFGMVVPTVYGPIIANRHDINQTNALIKTGRGYDHQSIELLRDLCVAGGVQDPVVVDVGANYGIYSLGLASLMGGGGTYHCFEAQRNIFNMLAGSVALNGYTNVYCYNAAVGEAQGVLEVPQFDYDRELNFGSVEFGGAQRESLHQEPAAVASAVEFVEVCSLDSFSFPHVDVLKIDVEGMESAVLRGASGLMWSSRPIMLIEHQKSDFDELVELVTSHNYSIYQLDFDLLCIASETPLRGVVDRFMANQRGLFAS